jgi:hypothetical protein
MSFIASLIRSNLPTIITAILVRIILAGIIVLALRRLLDAVLVVSPLSLVLAVFFGGRFVFEVVADGYFLGVPPGLHGLEVGRRLVGPTPSTLILAVWLLAQVDATQRRRWAWFAGLLVAIVVYAMQVLVDDGLFASSATQGSPRADPLVVSLAIASSVALALFFVVPLLYSLLTGARMPPRLAPYAPARCRMRPRHFHSCHNRPRLRWSRTHSRVGN